MAEPCKVIKADKEKVYELTSKWNTVAVVSDGTRVLGLGDIGPYAGLPVMEGKSLPEDWKNGVIFHCGPLMKKEQDRWKVVAAGPTTSSRMNSLEPGVLEKYEVSVIIGKGGMDRQVLEALKKYGGAYLAMVGGCAATAATAIKEVAAVHWLDLGMPEAMWVFEVENFGPFTVAMDAEGNSLYEKVDEAVDRNLQKIIKRLMCRY